LVKRFATLETTMPTATKVKSSGNKSKPSKSRSNSTPKAAVATGRRDARKPASGDKSASKASAKDVAHASKKITRPATAAAKSDADGAKSDARKMMRDSFRMPRADFDLLRTLKARARALGRPCKKSDLLRAGLHALDRYDDAQLLHAVSAGTPGRK
jgi:hypothetical protein